MTDSVTSAAAGPSNANVVPLPDTVRPDASFQSDSVRKRISSKRSILHLRRKKRPNDRAIEHQTPAHSEISEDEDIDVLQMPFIQLGNTVVYSAALEEDYSKDVYRWAIMYENQRGITLFSTPYYSFQSLLPTDPPAFTVPSTKSVPQGQPTVSLDTYQLPDGTWRWVSRAWMVDMRGEGQTQYDGFEYNWFFRTKHWRPEVGSLSAGGWVRRRRWVRLMVRPALTVKTSEGTSAAPTPHLLFQNIIHLEHHEVGMTRPPSVVTAPKEETESVVSHEHDIDVWQGDLEGDWERCHAVLKKPGTDGKRLELWRHWLGLPTQVGRPVRWTEDEGQHTPEVSGKDAAGRRAEELGQQPEKRQVAPILRNHAVEILDLFIYPDSRAHFLEIVGLADLLPDLNAGLGLSYPTQILDFYSSTQSFHDLLAVDMPASFRSTVLLTDTHDTSPHSGQMFSGMSIRVYVMLKAFTWLVLSSLPPPAFSSPRLGRGDSSIHPPRLQQVSALPLAHPSPLPYSRPRRGLPTYSRYYVLPRPSPSISVYAEDRELPFHDTSSTLVSSTRRPTTGWDDGTRKLGLVLFDVKVWTGDYLQPSSSPPSPHPYLLYALVPLHHRQSPSFTTAAALSSSPQTSSPFLPFAIPLRVFLLPLFRRHLLGLPPLHFIRHTSSGLSLLLLSAMPLLVTTTPP
ncbi:hypothetical protein NM688_g4237 [Phlebia brevispora]|uniref:Uncharacterized protein n=1 Tax=Phlebia brevispora TaxID=194682 RepID=A0ACC1T436_9APHY|nr:hypothetical protein NM688_g4237 [Phlebia brevispora]